jgi:hypothetical protein
MSRVAYLPAIFAALVGGAFLVPIATGQARGPVPAIVCFIAAGLWAVAVAASHITIRDGVLATRLLLRRASFPLTRLSQVEAAGSGSGLNLELWLRATTGETTRIRLGYWSDEPSLLAELEKFATATGAEVDAFAESILKGGTSGISLERRRTTSDEPRSHLVVGMLVSIALAASPLWFADVDLWRIGAAVVLGAVTSLPFLAAAGESRPTSVDRPIAHGLALVLGLLVTLAALSPPTGLAYIGGHAGSLMAARLLAARADGPR